MNGKNKKRRKVLIISMTVCILAGIFAGCGNEAGKYNKGANGMTITLKDEKNVEKVITKKPYKTPKFIENEGTFTISAVIGNYMVLQANTSARVFGNCFNDETGDDAYAGLMLENTLTGKKETFYGMPDKNGDFEIWISPHDYGGPYNMTFFDKEGHSVKYTDVLFGEVWILAGQSNMGWSLGQCYEDTTDSNRYSEIIENTHNYDVRWMGPWPVSSETPVEYLSSVRAWNTAEPETVKDWSAIGFFFALRLNELYDVPVGVISTPMGGISIEHWRKDGIWYNGMVNPVKKFSCRGVVWYQGEGDYDNYSGRLSDLIDEWRVEFENEDLFWCASEIARDQRDKIYYLCREEVKSLYGKVKNYAYAVTIDTGMFPEWCAEGDVLNKDGEHPYDKLKVGERLADAAAKECYGAEGLWSCPTVSSITAENGKIRVKFDNVGEGLTLVGSFGFEVKGETGKFYDAVPELSGKDTVILTCAEVESPAVVRYGFKNNRGENIKSAAESVCVYNTKNSEAAYPAEEFTENVGFSK